MGKLSAAESWFGRVGLTRGRGGGKQSPAEPGREAIGVLAFEVAGLMAKAAQLWHALADDRVARLRDEALRLEGVRKLVSDDDDFLLGLALAETVDSLGSLARSVARLGRRCSDPVLQRFDHVLDDLIRNGADLHGLEYVGRKMERKAKKMERLVAASGNLYQELEVLAELEQGLRRAQGSADPSLRGSLVDLRQRVAWQRHEVKCLREASLWGRSYDYTVRLLARSLFTIVGRIKIVFGFHQKEAAGWNGGDSRSTNLLLPRSQSVTGPLQSAVRTFDAHGITRFSSGPLTRSGPIAPTSKAIGGQRTPHRHLPPPSYLPPPNGKRHRTKWPVSGRSFGGCMVAGNYSPVIQSCVPIDSGFRSLGTGSGILPLSLFESKCKLLNAPPSTLGAAALALHYANVIIVIEKLVAAPHLIGPDAREDLYNMLPTSIRAALRARLKAYAKNLSASVYDPVLASEWSDALTRILEWLAPLAHNMIKWQSERNFEQQHLTPSSNVLLLQTLYFANQMKSEAAITELLVGLNYLWRFGRELNARAILECVSSRNYDDCFDSKG